MGREARHVRVDASLSRHNAPEDREDNEAFERLTEEIRNLVEADPDYRRIVVDVRGAW